MKQSFIFIAALLFSLNISAQKAEKQDSLNIPVILVDGVEVNNMDNKSKKYLKEIIEKYQEEKEKADKKKEDGKTYIR